MCLRRRCRLTPHSHYIKPAAQRPRPLFCDNQAAWRIPGKVAPQQTHSRCDVMFMSEGSRGAAEAWGGGAAAFNDGEPPPLPCLTIVSHQFREFRRGAGASGWQCEGGGRR